MVTITDGGGMGPWGMVLMLLLALLLMTGAFVAGFWTAGRRETDADELLSRRFAAGEIDEEEYLSRAAALEFR